MDKELKIKVKSERLLVRHAVKQKYLYNISRRQAMAKLWKDLIQYLIGGTDFYYCTVLGTCKHTSRVRCLEVLEHALTVCVVCCYLAMRICPTFGI